jgi:hypothetical protein
MMDSRGQLEQTHRQRPQIGVDLGHLQNVCVFGMQVTQTDRVARLAAIEAAFLRHDDAIIETERIDGDDTHAA